MMNVQFPFSSTKPLQFPKKPAKLSLVLRNSLFALQMCRTWPVILYIYHKGLQLYCDTEHEGLLKETAVRLDNKSLFILFITIATNIDIILAVLPLICQGPGEAFNMAMKETNYGGFPEEKGSFAKPKRCCESETDCGFRQFLRQRESFAKPRVVAKWQGFPEEKRVSQNGEGGC